MTQATCQTCRYYGNAGYGLGPCLRYPPVVTATNESGKQTSFPNVSSADWCGEHTPASKTQAAEVGRG